MNKYLTEIAFILDRSGSMSALVAEEDAEGRMGRMSQRPKSSRPEPEQRVESPDV